MVIYSVHVAIDEAVVDAWTTWMKDTHIPAVLATGYFLGHQFGRVVQTQPADGRSSFRIEYRCRSLAELESYQQQAAAELQADHNSRFAGRFVASRKVIELLSDHVKS